MPEESTLEQLKEIFKTVSAAFIDFVKEITSLKKKRAAIITGFHKRQDAKKINILQSKIKDL